MIYYRIAHKIEDGIPTDNILGIGVPVTDIDEEIDPFLFI
jgi:hypothetical protein